MSRIIASIFMSFIVSISLAGCWWDPTPKVTTQAAEDALNTLRHDLNGTDADRLTQDMGRLHGLSSDDFAGSDLKLRSTLIEQAAIRSLDIYGEFWAISEKGKAKAEAREAATNDTIGATDAFQGALADVTEDAIRGQTCKEMLDLVAPDPNPTATSAPDDQAWQGDIEQDATEVLAKTFGFTSIDNVMQWSSWYSDVTDAAQQATNSIAHYQTPDMQFLSNPVGQRATAIYVRYCYAPPTTN